MESVCSLKDLETLGFLEVQGRLAHCCRSRAGKELALELQPTADLKELEARRALHRQGRRLVEGNGQPDLMAPDIREVLRRVEAGVQVLTPRELLEVGSFVAAAREAARLADYCGRERDPELLDRLESLVDHTSLLKSIQRALSLDGTVRDGASTLLSRLRRTLARSKQEVRTELLSFARSCGDAVWDEVVTERSGRFVIPVKSDHRGRVAGIVHDFSASRQTAFVEPAPFVHRNNHIQETAAREREEVVRILRDLSRQVAGAAGELGSNRRILAELDLLFAAVSFGLRQDAVLCPLGDSDLELFDARHPLLVPAECVPIDIRSHREARLLLISGPNGGGKTVALKCLGILVLMHQSGLAIPVSPASRLPVWQRVVADIGDPQNLGHDSTYTGHLRLQKKLLDVAGDGWLALLDEVGAGTDPEEGAALAAVVLERLAARGVRIVATTHLLGIKAFAHEAPWAVLAATELSPETHQPTFKLVYGVPGRSSALQLAENLSFPVDLLHAARSRLQVGQVEFEKLVVELERARKRLDLAASAAELEKREARELRKQFELKKGRGFAAGMREFRRKSAGLFNEIQELLHRPRQPPGRGELRRMEGRISALAAEAAAAAKAPVPKASSGPAPQLLSGKICVGDSVLVLSLEIRGNVLALNEKRKTVTVQGPSFSLTLPIKDVRKILSEVAEEHGGRKMGVELQVAEKDLPMQIDLRGFRVEEGVEASERYLSDAVLAGFPSIRIIHGMGTGRLRKAIHGLLDGHPLVGGFRDGGETEGGLGATVVLLGD